MPIQLHWYNIDLRTVLTSQYKALEGGGKNTFTPLASCGYWLWWRNNHQDIIVTLDNSHYTHSTAFFDVPICHWSPRRKNRKSQVASQALEAKPESIISNPQMHCQQPTSPSKHLSSTSGLQLLLFHVTERLLKEFLQQPNLDSIFVLIAFPT